MSEWAKMYPSHGEYTKEKKELWKEALQKTIEAVKNMDINQVKQWLKKYKDTKPGSDANENTFEMTALYQRALQLLWCKEIKIDALFWVSTYRELKKVQEHNLQLKWKSIDGLPGPTTTMALIATIDASERSIDRENEAKKINEQDKKNLATTIENAKKPSMISRLSWNGSYYNGSSPAIIQYAMIQQPDGEFYIYDTPSKWVRTVYRITAIQEIKGICTITEKWEIIQMKWENIKSAPYQPTPIIKTSK